MFKAEACSVLWLGVNAPESLRVLECLLESSLVLLVLSCTDDKVLQGHTCGMKAVTPGIFPAPPPAPWVRTKWLLTLIELLLHAGIVINDFYTPFLPNSPVLSPPFT